MHKVLAIVLLALVALGVAKERTIRVEDKEFTVEVNASAVKMVAEDAQTPFGASGVKSVPQSLYEEHGITQLSGGGGSEYWADSTITYDNYGGSWKDKIYYSFTSGSPNSMQMGGYTRRLNSPDEVYYIEIELAYRVNYMRWADWETGSRWLHTGSIGHRDYYSYRYPKETDKSDSQTYNWDDGYSRLFKYFTGHAGYVPNQSGGDIYHDTHDQSKAKPDGLVRS